MKKYCPRTVGPSILTFLNINIHKYIKIKMTFLKREMTKWDYHMFFSFSSARRDFVGKQQRKWNFHQDDFWRGNSLSVQEYTALDKKSEVCMHWEGIEYLDRYLSHMCWKWHWRAEEELLRLLEREKGRIKDGTFVH